VTRECHAGICGSPGVRFPRATRPHKVRSRKTRPPRQRAAESPDSPGSTIVAWPWQTPAEAACPPRFDEPVTRVGAAGKRLRILKGMQPFWYLFVRFGWPLHPHRQPASPRPRVFDLPGTPAVAGAAWGMLLGSFGSSSFALLAVFVISWDLGMTGRKPALGGTACHQVLIS
jgi:hypothetical protein